MFIRFHSFCTSFVISSHFFSIGEVAVMEAHQKKLEGIVAQVKARPDGMKMSVRKNTPAHQIHNRNWKADCHRVDVSMLDSIVEYKEGTNRLGKPCLLAVCEGQVTMGQLAKDTLEKKSSVPAVVPELSSFTCAGLINGEGIQTSAHRYGVFTHTVVEMEVVLGNGEVKTCSLNENRELFTHLPESHGTLAIVTMVTIELVPAQAYVRSSYMHYSTCKEFVTAYSKLVREKKGAFLEGLVLARDSYLIILSDFATGAEARIGPIFDPSPEGFDGGKYYYQYIRQDVVKNKSVNIKFDYIETWNFLFRPMRGFWWMVECSVNFPPVTGTVWGRRIVDKAAHKEITQKGGFEPGKYLTREMEQRCFVLQDMGILLNRLEDGINWVNDRLGVYPLWICAVDASRSLKTSEEFLAHRGDERKLHEKIAEDGFVIDIGIYGEPTVQPFKHKRILKDLQAFVDAPSSWGVNYTKPEVLRKRHHSIREKYHAIGAFPGLEEKITYRGSIDDNIDEGPITCWRLYRDHGPYWWIKFPLIMIAFFGFLALLLYGFVVASLWMLR